MNSTLSFEKVQEELFISPHLANLINRVEDFPPTARRVLNYFVALGNRFDSIHPTQSTIALYAGCTREHVNVIIAFLVRNGLISKKYRHLTSCLYYLSPIFEHLEIRKKLSGLLPALKRWTFKLVLKYQILTQYKGVINMNITSKRKSGDFRPQEIKNKGVKQADESPPPPMSIIDRQILALERELRYERAIDHIRKSTFPRTTELDSKGEQYLKDNPWMSKFLEKIKASQ
jgi:hypothetical protein